MNLAVAGTFAAIALAAMAALAFADDKVMTAKGDLVIHPFHHASMLITWNGIRILVDPAPPVSGDKPADITAEYKAAADAPDLILVTHEHPDHFNVAILQAVAGADTILVTPRSVADKLPDDLKAKTSMMGNGDSATVKDVPIVAVPAYNTTEERAKFHPKGRDNGYVLMLGDKRIYIAGDTEETPEMKALTDVDVAFLPMNVPYTMTIEQAAQAVRDFKPKIVYPYHTAGSDVEVFKKLVGNAAEVRLLKWY